MFGSACNVPGARTDIRRPPWLPVPRQTPTAEGLKTVEKNIKQLMDLLLPSAGARLTQDNTNVPSSRGALDAEAYQLLAIGEFLPTARALGFIRSVPREIETLSVGFDDALRQIISTDLDALTARDFPGSTFLSLTRPGQEAVVEAGFAEPFTRPAMVYVRAVSFAAYLGAIRNDVGLIEIGFPPFENFAAGVAVRGYPRTYDGRLIDLATEDLRELARLDLLDDYTYNREPSTAGTEDLPEVLNADGDFP